MEPFEKHGLEEYGMTSKGIEWLGKGLEQCPGIAAASDKMCRMHFLTFSLFFNFQITHMIQIG